MVYLIILLIILFGIIRYDYAQKQTGRLFFWIILCIVMICVAGFRYRLGQDTVMYIKDYDSLHSFDQLKISDFKDSRFAPGFIILTSIFKMFTQEFVFFQIFQSLVVNVVLFFFFYKNCRHIFFAALIYFIFSYFLLTFQQLREALAVSIFLLAWPAFRDGRWIIWYIASFFAITFHISAFIMLILPIIYLPVIRQIFIFGVRTWVICLIVGVIAYGVQAVFFKYIEIIAVTESMMERAQTYQKSDLGGSLLNITGIIVSLIQGVIYPSLALYFVNKSKLTALNLKNTFDPQEAFVLVSVYISVFSIFVSIVGRYNNYFFPFVIVLLGDWIFSYIDIGKKKVKLNLLYWVILFLPFFSLQIANYFGAINRGGTLKGYMAYYPYSSYFDQERDADREKYIRYVLKHNR